MVSASSSRGMVVGLAAWLCVLLSSTVTGAPTPTPTPTVDTYAVPAPSAVAGSTTFAKVPNVQCDDIVSTASMQIYSNNRALFDRCVVEGNYQVFPFSGTLPTKAQITSMVSADSCRSVFTACVLANLPQCDIGGLALKSTTETLLKISVDVQEHKHEAPDSDKFKELLKWRRDVNLAQAKGLPYDQGSQLYGEYSRNLWKALTNTTVRVAENLTVSFDTTGVANKAKVNDMFINATGGSDRTDTVATVMPPTTVTDPASFVNNATTKSGSEPRPVRSRVVGLVVAMAVAVVVGSLW